MLNKKVEATFTKLLELYPEAKTELYYKDPFQLLIAVILSAQCTDERVNKTTPHLFKKYPDAKSLSRAKLSDVEKIIKSCGFYKMKAKAIVSTSKDLVEKFKSKIPKTLEELTTLKGVGRKTASVVLNQAFNLPAIAVDTHVKRVSLRLGWTENEDPFKVEMDLKKILPENKWSKINSVLILHGRRVCTARKPRCELCFVNKQCPTGKVLLEVDNLKNSSQKKFL